MPWGSTLHPTAESLEFLRSLFEEYLPLFRSDAVNVGGDEPWELGMGRSRSHSEHFGRRTLYGKFMSDVVQAASVFKPHVELWADILMEGGDARSAIPRSTTPLLWGYEKGHPFRDQVQALEKEGFRPILCPGTSTWNSMGGRLPNALANIQEAAEAAAESNYGLLLTDWGDHGHHQPDLLSWPARLAFAQLAWNRSAGEGDWEAGVDSLVFADPSGSFGHALLRLGRLGACFSFRPPNRLPLVQILTTETPRLGNVLANIPLSELAEAAQILSEAETSLGRCASRDPNCTLAHRELKWVFNILRHAVERSLAYCRGNPSGPTTQSAEMARLIGEFEELWICRNRIGGLFESSHRLRRALASYPTFPPRRPSWPPPVE